MSEWWHYRKDTLEMNGYTVRIESGPKSMKEPQITISLAAGRWIACSPEELPLIAEAVKEAQAKLASNKTDSTGATR